MMKQVTYEIELRLNGVLVGNVRSIAQDLKWRRCRTATGVDEIDFTLNDKVFAEWCEERNTTIYEMLTPYALDARIIRNGEAVAGGFLATMPSYQPQNDSANLQMRFDGYLNLLAGVYLRPTALVTLPAGQMVKSWIDFAEAKAAVAGKPFGITAGDIQALATIQRTFDNYKPVKEAITDLVDNVDGAGPFDVIFNPDRSYFITNQLGKEISSWQLHYPAQLAGQGVATISANEVQGFASHIIALGAGETSSDPAKSTVIISEESNDIAIRTYGYVEQLVQYSSVSRQTTLDSHALADLNNASNVRWQPQITLLGRQTPPSPTDDYGIFIGDSVWLQNDADMTGQTSGYFRVNQIDVAVSANGGEVITPELERIA